MAIPNRFKRHLIRTFTGNIGDICYYEILRTKDTASAVRYFKFLKSIIDNKIKPVNAYRKCAAIEKLPGC